VGAKHSKIANEIYTLDFFNHYYINKELSFPKICALVKEKYNFSMDVSQVRRRAIACGIKTRSKIEENILRASCDYSVSFLNEHLLEWIDGFLLGDGYIKPSSVGCAYGCTVQHEEFCRYLMKEFECYNPTFIKKKVYDPRLKNGFSISNVGTTKYHPDTHTQLIRWYPNGVKIIPKDVRITPLSTLLWFLGDGSYRKRDNRSELIFCTNGFLYNEIENILIKKLDKLDIKSHIVVYKRKSYSEYMIRIESKSIGDLFKFMLPNPVKCYQYKFTGMKKSEFMLLK